MWKSVLEFHIEMCSPLSGYQLLCRQGHHFGRSYGICAERYVRPSQGMTVVGTVGSQFFIVFGIDLATGLGGWKCYPHHPPTVLRWSHCILAIQYVFPCIPSYLLLFSVVGLIPREFSLGVDLG